MMTRGTTIRRRWGVEHDSALRGEAPNWDLLGVGWFVSTSEWPQCSDYWPASFETRSRARAAAQLLTERSRKHSPPGWRFRVVRIQIAVTRPAPLRTRGPHR